METLSPSGESIFLPLYIFLLNNKIINRHISNN
jgi:hypothetical protein